MPQLDQKEDIVKFPNPDYLTLQNFSRGVITLIDKSRLPKNALEEAINIFLVEDGQPSIRPGVDWFGVEVPNAAEIDGAEYYDTGTASHLVVVAGGNVYRSTDDAATWDLCSGGTLTSGEKAEMNQNGGFLYITTGADAILRYNGTTTLQTYSALDDPAAPSVAKTGLGATTYRYYYKVSAVNQVGFSEASTSDDIQVSLTRDAWDPTTNFVTVTGTVDTDSTRVDFYISEDNVDFFYVGSSIPVSGAYTFKDDGSAPIIPSTQAPTENTTTGPSIEELINVGGRQYGVRDRDNKYRIWFTGTGIYSGAFSNSYDGGYLDWQEGGKFIPVKVVDYRDGKGTPYATVWCKSADGQGSIIQMTIESLTIEDITISVPSAYQLPGSRGCPAPASVVNVLDDYYFYNSQAFYNLGSRAEKLNLLSTDEESSNIRPSVKRINKAAEEGICSVYYDAKVYFSVPYGTAHNSHVCVYDTERKAWLPEAFDIGFKKFLRYTDASKNQKLLAIKPGDARLSEISTGIRGDYGEAFSTSLKTGLYSTADNRFEFQWTEEGEIELSNPQGAVNVELSGIERTRGYSAVNTETITTRLINSGHSTFEHSTMLHSDTSLAVEAYSESSVKRYFNVQKELNAVQWIITTNTLDAFYILRTLQTWGTVTQAGKPRTWRI